MDNISKARKKQNSNLRLAFYPETLDKYAEQENKPPPKTYSKQPAGVKAERVKRQTRNGTGNKKIKTKKTLKKNFESACKYHRKRKAFATLEDELCLYGLYKQAVNGDCIEEEPTNFDMKPLQKFIAWRARQGTSKKRAMELYITTVVGMYPGFGEKLSNDFEVNRIRATDVAEETDQQKPPTVRKPTAQDLKKILSVNSYVDPEEDDQESAHKKPSEAFDRDSYRITISEDEYKRFTMMKIRKADSERTSNNKNYNSKMPKEKSPYSSVRRIIGNITSRIEYTQVNAREARSDEFAGKKIPKISLEDYIFRLVRYADRWFYDSPSLRSVGFRSLLMSVVYLNRLRQKNEDVHITDYNVHRLFSVCMLLGAKFSEDYIIANKYWAEVAGISIPELNDLEETFCNYMSFSFFVSEEEVDEQYYKYRN